MLNVGGDERTMQMLEKIRAQAPPHLEGDERQLFAVVTVMASGREVERMLGVIMPLVCDMVLQSVDAQENRDKAFMEQLTRMASYLIDAYAITKREGGEKGALH